MFHCDDLKREDLNSKIRLIDLKHQHHRGGASGIFNPCRANDRFKTAESGRD